LISDELKVLYVQVPWGIPEALGRFPRACQAKSNVSATYSYFWRLSSSPLLLFRLPERLLPAMHDQTLCCSRHNHTWLPGMGPRAARGGHNAGAGVRAVVARPLGLPSPPHAFLSSSSRHSRSTDCPTLQIARISGRYRLPCMDQRSILIALHGSAADPGCLARPVNPLGPLPAERYHRDGSGGCILCAPACETALPSGPAGLAALEAIGRTDRPFNPQASEVKPRS
jgi:hypothetical protein